MAFQTLLLSCSIYLYLVFLQFEWLRIDYHQYQLYLVFFLTLLSLEARIIEYFQYLLTLFCFFHYRWHYVKLLRQVAFGCFLYDLLFFILTLIRKHICSKDLNKKNQIKVNKTNPRLAFSQRVIYTIPSFQGYALPNVNNTIN